MERKKQILVVEDDTAIALGLKELLIVQGYAVHVERNGVEALKWIKRRWPDSVLLDVNLPGLSGFEVCRRARAVGFTRPIIMLTARREQIDKVMGLEIGASDYVTKPFEPRELAARLRSALRFSIDEASSTRKRLPADGSRRLMAIMFSDIKDFSKRMNESEKLGLEMLEKHNAKLTAAIRHHEGRVIEIIGNAFLVSFGSALRAVECAVAIQTDLKAYNKDRPPKQQIRVRIGIHLGDVLQVENNLRGDAVNIAARLQQSALPGTIYVSQIVVDSIRGKSSLKTRKFGTRKVKNIKQPITIYKIGV